MNEKNLAGIDFSLTNTGVTIIENDNTYFYMFPKSKPRGMLEGRVNYIKRNIEDEKSERRYISLAQNIISVLTKHNVGKVYIEDYALTKIDGYKINLIEGTAVLKALLIMNGFEVETKSVSYIKKNAVGNGSADKYIMLKEFLKTFPDMKLQMESLKKYGLDISDSYFVVKSGVSA